MNNKQQSNLLIAIESLYFAVTCLEEICCDLIDLNDYRLINARSHLNDSLEHINEAKLNHLNWRNIKKRSKLNQM